MLRTTHRLFFLSFLFALSSSAVAFAQDDSEGFDDDFEAAGEASDGDAYNPELGDGAADATVEEASASGESFVHVTVGAKVGIGANLLTAPDKPAGLSAPYDDGVGGIGFGGGLFGEARILDGHLGAELGFIFDSSSNWSEFTSNGVDYEPAFSTLDLRMPLLVNAGTGDSGVRLAVGTGPEFVFPLSASAETTGPGFSARGNTISETHVNWLFNLGLSAPIAMLRITFDIRFAYNLATKSDYFERVVGNLASGYSVVAQHEMDLRLLLGLGYDLPL